MRAAILLSIGCLVTGAAWSQRLDPVQWSLKLEPSQAPPGSRVLGRLTATVQPGWHLYSMTTPASLPTEIKLAEGSPVSLQQIHQQQPVRKYDPNFQADSETYEGTAEFLVEMEIPSTVPAGAAEIVSQVKYNVCDATRCLPPRRKTAAATLTVQPGSQATEIAIPAGFVPVAARTSAPPVTSAPPEEPAKPADEGLGTLIPVAFGFGLLAIFTPCVFPMIPITMSFFLNKESATRRQAVNQAVLFCLGIIVLFSGLGLLTTAILGPFGVVQLGSNPWVNLVIAALFLAFGLSLLGAFEITIPSSILTKLNQASEKGGVAGTLLMGLAFSLTSFACVGPFVGPLLAASAQGGGIRPLVGMVAFATGLSAPFLLLALFPSYLKRMPRSGGWLARVKVVMAFIILAFMLKYLSNVDQVMQWHLLTRERFLAAWVVLFALPGLYLLGFLRLEGVSDKEPLGIGRLLSSVAFLVFSLSLVPGMFGGRLGEIDAYVPLPLETARGGEPAGPAWLKNDLPGAIAQAKAEGKFVFVNFTGYACTNCHWMKANMFTRPEIRAVMDKMVLVELYTDGTDEISEANQKLQDSRFATVAIPYYAILDADEKVVATFPGLTRKPDEFLAFLRKGEPSARS